MLYASTKCLAWPVEGPVSPTRAEDPHSLVALLFPVTHFAYYGSPKKTSPAQGKLKKKKKTSPTLVIADQTHGAMWLRPWIRWHTNY